MSIKLLRSPGSLHEVHDDLESAFWVLAYTALHRFKQDGPTKFNMKCFSEMELSSLSDGGHFVKGGESKTLALVDRKFVTIEFSSLPVREVLSELTSLFAGYSLFIPGNGALLTEESSRIKFEAHYKWIGKPRNVAKIIRPYTKLSDDEWDLHDWETVDKYPRLTLVKSTTQQAKAEILKFTRSAAGTQPSASGSQAKATGPSGSLRRRQNPKHSQPAFMLPVIRNTLPESASASSSWQSADIPDSPHSNKRSLVADGSSTSVNKKARANNTPEVEALLALLKQERRKVSYLTSKLQILTQGEFNATVEAGNSPRDSVDNDVLADLERNHLDADPQSGPPSTHATPCNSSPALSTKSFPNEEEDPVELDNSSTLPVLEDSAFGQGISDSEGPLFPFTASSTSSLDSLAALALPSTSRRVTKTYSKKDRKGKGKAREV